MENELEKMFCHLTEMTKEDDCPNFELDILENGKVLLLALSNNEDEDEVLFQTKKWDIHSIFDWVDAKYTAWKKSKEFLDILEDGLRCETKNVDDPIKIGMTRKQIESLIILLREKQNMADNQLLQMAREPAYEWWGSLSINEQNEWRGKHPFFGQMSLSYFQAHPTSILKLYEFMLSYKE